MFTTVNTSELQGAALDWVVAKCEGYTPNDGSYDGPTDLYFSTDWAQGGPIIEREAISVCLGSPVKGLEWMACDRGSTHIQHGPAYLIAAMRCYVASKLGDAVDIPGEFL
jgi:hypothetical protein